MIEPIIRNRLNTDYSNIGAVVCRTPKTLIYKDTDEDGNEIAVDHRCELVSSVDDLVKYFGDPYIDPYSYTDLLVAYDLVRRGILVYISSVYEMLDHQDGFEIAYNGYTEFTFVDENSYDNVGYKLKSDIKFCQPVLRSTYNGSNRLDLYVDLYILDRNTVQDKPVLTTFDQSYFYKTLHFIFDTSYDTSEDEDTHIITYTPRTTDKAVIDTLWNNGLELKVVNSDPTSETSLVDTLKSYKVLNINFNSCDANKEASNTYNESRIERNTPYGRYWYDLHSDDYRYDFHVDSDVVNSYINAIELLTNKKPAPHMLCISRIYIAKDIVDNNTLIRSYLKETDYDTYTIIQTKLLEYFNQDCDTYLFISTIDSSFSKLYELLTSDDPLQPVLPYNYNCDICFGFASDYIERVLPHAGPTRVFYPASLLSFYNLLSNKTVYNTNSVSRLNISNGCVKSTIPESSAKKLADLRCNSLVLFDIGAPSIYGDRSLSLSPNLRFSHISRNVVRMRRLVREYLETKKFMLNTSYNVRTCVNYIKTDILDEFKKEGIISEYSIDFTTQHQTVFINVILLFSAVAESIKLDFII